MSPSPVHRPPTPNPQPPSGVCLLTGELPPDVGGVGDYTACLSRALAAGGARISILTTGRRGGPTRRDLTVEAGVAAIPVQAIVPAWDLRAWPIVLGAVRRLGPRPILHIQYQTGAFGLQGAVNLVPLLIRAALPRARVVTTFHDFLPPYLFPKAGPLRPAANRVLAQTSHAAIFAEPSDLALAGPGVRGHLIPIGSNVDCAPPPGYDRSCARRSLGADGATLVIGYFGFLHRSKGVPSLLHALASMARTGRAVRLVLVGAEAGVSDPTDRGRAGEVRELVARLDLGELVTATGPLPSPDVSATLLACDILALPYRDGASLRRGTLMAGLAHGLPIVSTRRPRAGASSLGALPDREPRPLAPSSTLDPTPRLPPRAGEGGHEALPPSARRGGAWGGVRAEEGMDETFFRLRDGEELLLVPPDDSAALAWAITRLADDPVLRARLARNARASAAQIAWPTIARRTLAVYQGVGGRGLGVGEVGAVGALKGQEVRT